MFRDIHRNIEYFNDYIKYEESRICKYVKKLSEIPDDKRDLCNTFIASSLKNKLTAQYSRGDTKEEIKDTFFEYLNYVSKTQIKSYIEYIDILSLGILFDIEFGKIETFVIDEDLKDSLTKGLEQYLKTKKIEITDEDVLFPKEFKEFYDYLVGKKDKGEFLSFIKNSWYMSCTDFYWFDSHNSKEDIYAGYWSWLGAAILKMKDDKLNEIIQYIPSELI